MGKNTDLKMFMNYRRMRHIKRCNTLPTICPIDVAQHSYYVAMLAMSLADEYNTWLDSCKLGFKRTLVKDINAFELANVEVVLRKALLHDTEEAIVSDIPWNIKHMDDDFHKVLTEAINRKMDNHYKKANTMKMYHEIHKECKHGLEGDLVNLADMLELAIYCYEEVCMGNSALNPMLDKCINLIQEYPIYKVLRVSSELFKSILFMLMLEHNGKDWSNMIEID